MNKGKFPNYFLFTFYNFLFIWFSLLIFRLLTWFLVFPKQIRIITDETLLSFYIGSKFDMRVVLCIIVPVFLLSMIFSNKYFTSKSWKRFNSVYFSIIIGLLLFIYSIDIGNYLYLNERVTVGILEFLKNPLISGQMMWETYPIIWILIGLIFVFLIIKYLIRIIYNHFSNKIFETNKWKKYAFILGSFVMISAGIYGKFGYYPLRWSEAYFSTDKDISQLTLNPILNFISSVKFNSIKADENETKKYFPVVAKYLGIPHNKPLDFKRSFTPLNDSIANPKNIIIIMMESLGAQPLGVFNNPANASPFIDSLAQNSWFFDNFYVTRFGTAHSVYSSLTGLPDVFDVKTASRDPKAVDQKVILNQMNGYEKLYFLGGSANWANIRALFTNNIEGIKIYEEGSYENENRADVWGIDDYDLFENSSKILGDLHKKGKPFISFIQTSSYHPPYTVPEKRGNWRPLTKKEVDEKKILASGFENFEEFNSLRYFDYNLKQFFNKTKKLGFYDDTVFILWGDHNGHVGAYKHMDKPEYETEFGQNHVPFIIHGKNIPKKRDHTITQLIDLYPTVADILNKPYINYTLGRSVLRRTAKDINTAFLYQDFKGKPSPGTLWDNFFYYAPKKGNAQNILYDYSKNNYAKPYLKIENSQKSTIDSLTKGLYQSTLYLYFNNKK